MRASAIFSAALSRAGEEEEAGEALKQLIAQSDPTDGQIEGWYRDMENQVGCVLRHDWDLQRMYFQSEEDNEIWREQLDRVATYTGQWSIGKKICPFEAEQP